MEKPALNQPKFIKVKDISGHEWLCLFLNGIKNAKYATKEELAECVELKVIFNTAGLLNLGIK